MVKRAMFQQPDPEDLQEELKRRTVDEAHSVAPLRGSAAESRVNRTEGIGLKISREKREQFERLRLLSRWSYTDIFETALDAFEVMWKEGKIGKGLRR